MKVTLTFLQSCILLRYPKKNHCIHLKRELSLPAYDPFKDLITGFTISKWQIWMERRVTTGFCRPGQCVRCELPPLCGSVCSHCPSDYFRLSQLCTNSPPGSSGLSHLLSACWASSNLAASDGGAGALCVSSPQDCQKSSVKSPYRLALQAPRKLTRRRDRGGADTGRNFIFQFMLQQ